MRNDATAAVSGGICLIGLGMLMMTNWWWPGIMFVIGTSIAAGMLLRGQWMPAAVVAAVFFLAPVAITTTFFPWVYLIGFLLIALGGAIIIRSMVRARV